MGIIIMAFSNLYYLLLKSLYIWQEIKTKKIHFEFDKKLLEKQCIKDFSLDEVRFITP
jgi:hypothetical protein